MKTRTATTGSSSHKPPTSGVDADTLVRHAVSAPSHTTGRPSLDETLDAPAEALQETRDAPALAPGLDETRDASGLDRRLDAREPTDRDRPGPETHEPPGLLADATLDASDSDLADGPAKVRAGRIGRYTVVRELGRGGMGIVYACYDEGLDRKVAVKLLLRQVADVTAQLRLEREAQALARLSHPNVVQIYELGRHDENLFVAMEFVPGQSLRDWLSPADADGADPDEPQPEQPEPRPDRDWREVLAMLRQAGAGLEAAHAAGLVHRDFKPDNAMVGADGRLRVLDFGLVRDAARPELDPVREDAEAEIDPPPLSLTRTGAVMGTPAYMAPEQFRGQPSGPFTDQFSFCVVAYEALFGQRPFAGKTFHSLAFAVCKGDVRPIPTDSPVPASLRAAILRGLAVEPGGRWPDMPSLLAEFDAVLGQGRRKLLGWGVAAFMTVTALAVGGFALANDDAEPAPVCAIEADVLAGTWDDARRAELAAAFAAQPGLSADANASGRATVEAALDQWSEGYLASLRDNCEATRVRGTQSESLLDLRSACLDRKRREADAVVGLLVAADGPSHAPELLGQLPELGGCDDPRLAGERYPLPSEAERREAILAAYEQLARIRGLGAAGRLDEADEAAERLRESVAGLDYLPLTVEADGLRGEQAIWRQAVNEAVPLLRGAIRAAEVAELDELSANLRVHLAGAVMGAWGRVETQDLTFDEAQTAVDRLGRGDDRLSFSLQLAGVHQLVRDGELDRALVKLTDQQRTNGQTEDYYAGYELGQVLTLLGRLDEAERTFERHREIAVAKWGEGSPASAMADASLGEVSLAAGDLDGAERRFRAAQEVISAIHGPRSPPLAAIEANLGKIAFMRGDVAAARSAFRAAADSNDASMAVEAWNNLAVIEFFAREYPASLRAYRRAVELATVSRGPSHPSIGVLYSNIGESLAGSGDHEGALDSYRQALAILTSALPPDHIDFAFPYKGRAQSRLALGDPTGALVDLERALELHELNPNEPLDRADVEFTLAKVHRALGDEARAREWASTARTRLLEIGQAEQAAAIDDWLAH